MSKLKGNIMKTGCLMKFLGGMKDEINIKLNWAKENGFNELEIGGRDIDYFSQLKDARKKYELNIVALNFCFNFLINNQKEQIEYINDLKKIITIASEIGAKTVVTATGRNPEKSLESNINLYKEVFTPIAEFAKKKSVRLAFENSAFLGRYRGFPIGNIATSPFMWKKIFEILPSENLGLTLDPSHLVWQFIDPYQAIKDFAPFIFHVHAKDTEILREKLSYSGMFDDNSWHRNRLPGFGEINWSKFISLLIEYGYNGLLSIEAIDPIWGNVAEDDFGKKGILLARNYFSSITS